MRNSAFPTGDHSQKDTNYGISKRFYAACKAMHGIINNEKFLTDLHNACDSEWVKLKEAISVNAFEIADEMLKQEEQK